MKFSYAMLLDCVSVIQSSHMVPNLKAIRVTTDFYDYLEAKHEKNKFLREYEGNTVSYIMGIPVIVDDTVDNDWAVEFEEENEYV